MSITSEISRIQTNIANAYTAAEAKGATMPVTENSDSLAITIESITGGGGEQIEAVNNTGSAITSGDKVWVNKDIQNTSVTGSPEINYQTNSVSNFSNSNYLSILEKFNPSTSDWECQIKITTGPVNTGEQCIVSNTQEMKGIRIAITNTGKFEFLVAGSNGWISVSHFSGSYTCLANTTYWIKAGYSKESNQYYLLYSLDGAQYYNDISYSPNSSDNKIIAPCNITFGNGPIIGDSISAISFSGTIHFSDTYISVDKYYWYKPILIDSDTNYINDYTLHTYNISSYGFPSAVQGIVNRTSKYQYYKSDKPISYSSSDAWEIGMSWKRSTTESENAYVLSFGYWYSGLYIGDSVTSFGVSIGNGSGWMGNIGSVTVSSIDNRIWVKVVHNGLGTYYILWSTDGVNYTKTEDVQIGTAELTNKYLRIGECDSEVNSFNCGNIFLEDCYVKVNNKEVWRGYTKTNEIIAPESAQTGTAAESIAVGSTGLVNVGAVIEPVGSITITTNGTHDVTDYAEAIVNVPVPAGDKYKVGDRVTDDSNNPVGTVSSIFTDGDGNRYAVVCLDAVNRLASGQISSTTSTDFSSLPTYNDLSVWSATETATENTSGILNIDNSSETCTHCRSKSFIIDGVTYYGQLPNLLELVGIYVQRITINENDPTALSYSSLIIPTATNVWCSTFRNAGRYQSFYIMNQTGTTYYNTVQRTCFVVPVLEIPL